MLSAILCSRPTSAAGQGGPCPGDCDGSGRVTLSELVQVVNIGLGKRSLTTCEELDADGGGVATVDEMVLAVERSLNGCPRMLEGPEALRGASQVALSTMDSLLVLNFGFVSAGGGGGGAGGEETIPCQQGSKVVSRRTEGASCLVTTTYDGCVEADAALGAVKRDGTSIQTIADAGACTPPGQIPPGVNVSVTMQGFTQEFSASDGTGVELFASALLLAREATGEGASRTTLDGSLRVRRTTGERFTQLFDGFVVTETVDDSGSIVVTQNGRVSVDCIGDLELETTLPIVLSAADASCPVGGELEVEETPRQEGAAASFFAERTIAEPIVAGQQTAVDLGFGASLFRAANGPVYQVLRNAGADADEGAEAVRVTTLVGSTGAASACESSAGNGVDATAIAASASAPFDVGAVRKSAVIRDATPPCFNGNAEGGDGSVCIGPDCGTDCACEPGERCAAFTFDAGVAITQATEEVPAAEIADLRDLGAGPCSGFAYAFGTAAPTTRAAECAADESGEGFALPVEASRFTGGTEGSTIVFAYDAPLLSDFRASHAGFSVDLDGKNRVGCSGTNTLLGLGIASTDRTPPPRIGFTSDGGITFDLDGRDDLLNGLVETCRFPVLAACVGPTEATPTPTPSGSPEIPTLTPAGPAVLPDLVATALDGPSAATSGTEINVSATVQNADLREASAFDVAFVLSANGVITEDDPVLGLCSFSQLAAATRCPARER